MDGTRAIFIIIFRQPGANIIQTVDRIQAQMPFLEAVLPQGIKTTVVMDRTTTIRASVSDVEKTLIGSVILVVLVVFIFLRSPRTTLIPIVAVPVSLIGTFAVMYLFDYSLDNLSLMALTVATGFVVDDAIVVMENITRHLEAGMEPFAAAFQGAKEIGFTVFSISMSLIAVFIPILLMGGIVGRLFREFAVVLSTAILVSMMISLTTTPMMCAYLLKDERTIKHGSAYRVTERGFTWMLSTYSRSLTWVLKHPRQRTAVRGEHPCKPTFSYSIRAAMLDGPLVLEQIGAHHGRGGQRDEHRHNDGRRQRDGKLAEQPADDACHEKDGNEDRNQRQADGKDSKPYLFGTLKRGLPGWHTLFPEAGYVLQDYDGVVHDKAGRDGQCHQRKIVDAEAKQVHDGEGGYERRGDRDGGNEIGRASCRERV